MLTRPLPFLLALGLMAALPLPRDARAQEARTQEVRTQEVRTQEVRTQEARTPGAPESEKPLQHVLAYLREKRLITMLRIEGHTDNEGAPTMLQTLREKRSVAVPKN